MEGKEDGEAIRKIKKHTEKEKKKKRLATLAIVGAMTVSAVAPMSVFAAGTPQTGESNVMYVAGAVTPGGSDGGYYVTIPSDIVFTDDNASGTQELSLKKLSSATLPSNLSVSVTVSSTNDGQLKNTSVAPSVALDYQVDYSGQSGSGTAGNETLSNATPDSVNVGTFTGEGTLTGSATLLDKVADVSATVPNGTEFTDVLTYTITQDTP